MHFHGQISIKPVALRKAKNLRSFGHSECSRVNVTAYVKLFLKVNFFMKPHVSNKNAKILCHKIVQVEVFTNLRIGN